MTSRMLKKVEKRRWISNSRTVDCDGGRFERFRYVRSDRRNGKLKIAYCRVVDFSIPDPITDSCGCAGEIMENFARRDRREGCPLCEADV